VVHDFGILFSKSITALKIIAKKFRVHNI